MVIHSETLKNRVQTANKIYSMAENFWPDLDDFGLLEKDIKSVFNHVKRIPYKEDKKNEIVARPGFLLNREIFPALDCKKKAVIMGSWLEAHGMPWRLVGTSERMDRGVHHIFNQVKIDGNWYNVDSTYPEFELFEPKPDTTYAEEFY